MVSVDRPIAQPNPDQAVRAEVIPGMVVYEEAIGSALTRERTRMAQLFHHTLCQSFSGIELMAKVISSKFRDAHPEAAFELEEFERHVRKAVNDLHSIADWLKPFPEEFTDLVTALGKVAARADGFVPCVFEHSVSRPDPLDPIRAAQLAHIANETIFALLSRNDIAQLNLRLSDTSGRLAFTIDARGPELGEDEDSVLSPEWKLLRYRASLIGASVTISSIAGTTIHVTFTPRSESPN